MGLAKERSEGSAIPRSPMGGAGQWDIAAGETLDLLVKRFVVVPTLRDFSQRGRACDGRGGSGPRPAIEADAKLDAQMPNSMLSYTRTCRKRHLGDVGLKKATSQMRTYRGRVGV